MSLRKFIKETSVGRFLYWNYRITRDSLRVFSNFSIKDNRLSYYFSIRRASKMYGWNPDEYFLYHFEDLSHEQRLSFVSEKEHVRIADALNTCIDSRRILQDKWTTYEVYQKFFNRKACKVCSYSSDEMDSFINLLNISGKLIIKPFDGSFGKGIRILNASEQTSRMIMDLKKDYPHGFIAEEVIIQDSRMAYFHPESVNTIRIHTISYGGTVYIFHPYLRMGRGCSIVDNAGSGGVFTSCNPTNGEILSVVDEYGKSYVRHPDNHVQLIGVKVPCWEQAYTLAKELALTVPNIHYAGWDLALTKNGWVLVEGNPRAQFVFQISEQKGVYNEIQALLDKVGVSYKR